MARTIEQITADIQAIRAADRAYNRSNNEGGYGYERDSVPASLIAEYDAAVVAAESDEAAAFAAEWTLEVFTARRAEWNEGARALAAKHGKSIPAAAIRAQEARLGYTMDAIIRAKQLHGA